MSSHEIPRSDVSVNSDAGRCNKRHADALESTVPAKRLRRCDDYRLFAGNMPASRKLRSDSSPLCGSNVTPPSHLSKWQSPRTSPLGPKSSTYHRRSMNFPQPSKGPTKAFPTLSWSCIHRVFSLDIKARDPHDQDAQWCQDLNHSGLKDVLHPDYQCPHLYHPCDSEYDEEWADESWSDEEWSDNEDTLSPSEEEKLQAQIAEEKLRIDTLEQPSTPRSSKNYTFVHWNNWGNTFSSNFSFNPPLSWDGPDSVVADEKEQHGGTEPADIVAAA